MMVLVAYDVAQDDPQGAKRLRHIARHCENYGMRVQYSVFECEVEPAQWVALKARLLDSYDPERDSLRFYLLGSHWKRKVEHYGAKPVPDILRDTLIV